MFGKGLRKNIGGRPHVVAELVHETALIGWAITGMLDILVDRLGIFNPFGNDDQAS